MTPWRMAHSKTPNDVLFLAEASRLYEDQCPELSRFLMQKAHAVTENKSGERDARGKDGGPVPVLYACQYCRQRFKPDNHRVRLRPKKRPAARVQRVLRREAWGRRLSVAQRELLRRFRGSSSVLMATCHTCNKMSRYNGVNRDFLVAFAKTRGTPGSNGKHRTPQAVNRSTPKSVGKEKTPSRTPSRTPSETPRSASSGTPGSGSSSSSKSTSGVKKWVVQRLSKILHRDQKPDAKKGTLKDFLSSL